MKTHASTVVEFVDRGSDYWEVVEIPHRPATVVGRIQQMLAVTGELGFREFNVSARIGRDSIVIEFDRGRCDAELFGTLLAETLGWRKEHGVLVGRAKA